MSDLNIGIIGVNLARAEGKKFLRRNLLGRDNKKGSRYTMLKTCGSCLNRHFKNWWQSVEGLKGRGKGILLFTFRKSGDAPVVFGWPLMRKPLKKEFYGEGDLGENSNS